MGYSAETDCYYRRKEEEQMDYETQRLDHLGIVAGVCDKIELVEQIDAMVGQAKRKVSVGESVKAMVLNALGFVSRPLYLSDEFFLTKPIGLLFRPDLEPADFNNDSLGRALDALFEGNVTTIFAQVSSKGLTAYQIAHRFFHLDTTSFSFYGQFLKEVDETIRKSQREGEEGVQLLGRCRKGAGSVGEDVEISPCPTGRI
jgi:transposase